MWCPRVGERAWICLNYVHRIFFGIHDFFISTNINQKLYESFCVTTISVDFLSLITYGTDTNNMELLLFMISQVYTRTWQEVCCFCDIPSPYQRRYSSIFFLKLIIFSYRIIRPASCLVCLHILVGASSPTFHRLRIMWIMVPYREVFTSSHAFSSSFHVSYTITTLIYLYSIQLLLTPHNQILLLAIFLDSFALSHGYSPPFIQIFHWVDPNTMSLIIPVLIYSSLSQYPSCIDSAEKKKRRTTSNWILFELRATYIINVEWIQPNNWMKD